MNGGSLEKELLQKYGVCAEAMVESAQRHAELLENCGFGDIVVSLKASDPVTTVRAYRLASQIMPYPLHIGVTEAGMGETAAEIRNRTGACLLTASVIRCAFR